MQKVLATWIKVVLIILGIALVAVGAIILLTENEPKLEEMPTHSTEILAQHFQTISSIEQ